MKRFLLSFLVGIIIQGFVILFWILSSHFDLPPVLDYLLAPGLIPTAFYSDSSPPTRVFVFGFIIDIGLYTMVSHFLLRVFIWLRNRRTVTTGMV